MIICCFYTFILSRNIEGRITYDISNDIKIEFDFYYILENDNLTKISVFTLNKIFGVLGFIIDIKPKPYFC